MHKQTDRDLLEVKVYEANCWQRKNNFRIPKASICYVGVYIVRATSSIGRLLTWRSVSEAQISKFPSLLAFVEELFNCICLHFGKFACHLGSNCKICRAALL